MDSDSVIIDNSAALGYRYRAVQVLVTLFFWCAWIYLALPLASPIAAFFGLDLMFHDKMDLGLFLGIFLTIAIVTLYMLVTVIMWRFYNLRQHRFIRCDYGERGVSYVLSDELAGHFGVNISELGDWHQSRGLSIKLAENGRIQYVLMAQAGERA